ncbi:AMP-binding protein, partial [Actinoallomurus acaciae]
EDRVALAIGRPVETVVATAGVPAAGEAYVPVDPDYPPQRVALMLEDSDAALVVCAAGTELPRTSAPRLEVDGPDGIAAFGARPGDDGTEPLTDEDRRAPLRPDNAAYVIYTSGSTGRPKGTVVSHAALRNHLHWAGRDFPGLDGHTLMHSSTSFDFSITPLLGTLVHGGVLELCEDTLDALAGASGAATFLKITPSHAPLLSSVRFAADAPSTLLVAGEALRGEALAGFAARRPERLRVVNEYGPTEVCVGALCHHLPPGTAVPDGAVPIGTPVANTAALVLDARLNPVPPGVAGELYLAGVQ